MAKLSASQIVPPEFQEMLVHFAEDGDRSAWGIGDIAATLEEELITIPNELIWKAVGSFSSRSYHTIRDYAYTSRNVPMAIRQRYDMMGRHHLKALIPHVDKMGGWDAACNAVLSWGDDYGGNLIPVHALRAKLADGSEDPAWLRRLRRMRASGERLASDSEAPLEVREFTNDWLTNTAPNVGDLSGG